MSSVYGRTVSDIEIMRNHVVEIAQFKLATGVNDSEKMIRLWIWVPQKHAIMWNGFHKLAI